MRFSNSERRNFKYGCNNEEKIQALKDIAPTSEY